MGSDWLPIHVVHTQDFNTVTRSEHSNATEAIPQFDDKALIVGSVAAAVLIVIVIVASLVIVTVLVLRHVRNSR